MPGELRRNEPGTVMIGPDASAQDTLNVYVFNRVGSSPGTQHRIWMTGNAIDDVTDGSSIVSIEADVVPGSVERLTITSPVNSHVLQGIDPILVELDTTGPSNGRMVLIMEALRPWEDGNQYCG